MRVLLVEDDAGWAQRVMEAVESLGGEVAWMTSVATALDELRDATPPYQIVILDRRLSDETTDSLPLIDQLRAEAINVPVVVLSHLSSVDDRVEGYRSGAVAYLCKPFEAVELLAVLRVHLNRFRMVCGNLELDIDRRLAYWRGARLPLSPQSFAILQLLTERAGDVVLRSALHRRAWNSSQAFDRDMIDSAIRRLRLELRRTTDCDPIETVQNAGYRLVVPLLHAPAPCQTAATS